MKRVETKYQRRCFLIVERGGGRGESRFEVYSSNKELPSAQRVLLVMATNNGGAKAVGLREFLADKVMVAGGEQYRCAVKALEPKLDESNYNGHLNGMAELIAALKVAQVGSEVDRGMAYGDYDQWGAVGVVGNDVLVDVDGDETVLRWRTLGKLHGEISDEQLLGHLREVIGPNGNSELTGCRKARVRVGIAAELIILDGKPVGKGLVSGLESFFNFEPVSDEGIEDYINWIRETKPGLVGSVCGGCVWDVGLLAQRIICFNHADRDDQPRRQLERRLQGKPPEQVDLMAALIDLVKSGRSRLPQTPASHLTKRSMRELRDFLPSDCQQVDWGGVAAASLRDRTYKIC